MPNKYEKYGISESYIPKIYFNKITVDTINYGVNLDKSILPYIDESIIPTEWVKIAPGPATGDEGYEVEVDLDFFEGYNKQTNEKPKTIITAESKIIFNVSNEAEFKRIVEDDDFNKALELYYYVFYSKVPPDNKIFAKGPGGSVIASDPYILNILAKNTSNYVYKKRAMPNVLNQLVSQNYKQATSFDMIKKYKKIFPNGEPYYEIPHVVTFELEKQDPENIYLLAFSRVKDFELDLTLNFGQFEIKDPSLTVQFSQLEGAAEGNNVGPHTFETVVRNGSAQRVGAIFTISNNQAASITEEAGSVEWAWGPLVVGGYGWAWRDVTPTTVEENNIAREAAFNDLKGTPWFGGVHKRGDRFMVGDTHTSGLHPYLDINYVSNNKVIDLRPIKKIKEAQIDFSSLVDILNNSDINYLTSNNSVKRLYEDMTIISDPLLSVKTNGRIDGLFAVDYTKFLKKYGLVPSLLEHLADTTSKTAKAFTSKLVSYLKHSLQNNLNMRVERIGPKKTKTIYDSNFTDSEGRYPLFGISNSVDGKNYNVTDGGRLGYLNVIDMSTETFTNVSDVSLVEYYNFSDLDPSKQFNVKYRYKVYLSFDDPLYQILIDILRDIDSAIGGTGKRLGLKQLISMASVMTKNVNILNESSSPYIKGNYIDLQPEAQQNSVNLKIAPVKTLLETVQDYDIRNGTDSLLGPKVGMLRDLYNFIASSGLPILLNSQKTGVQISEKDQVSMILATNFTDEENIYVDGMTYVLNTLESVRQNLSNIINGLSNVNAPKTSVSTTKSALLDTKSAGSANSSLRRISAKRVSSTYVIQTDFGFDYTDIFFRNPATSGLFTPLRQLKFGLKQITASRYMAGIRYILQNYYSDSAINKNGLGPVASVNENGYTYLPLFPDGITLPKRLKTYDEKNQDWEAILQSLMLFKRGKLSRLDAKSIFRMAQESIGGIISDTQYFKKNSPESLPALKLAERNQSLAADTGLSIQDREIVQTSEEYTKNDSPLGQDLVIYKSTKISHTNVTTNNFLSYINNLTEGANIAPLPDGFLLNQGPVDLSSLQSLALVFFRMSLLGAPGPIMTADFATIYHSIFYAQSNQIYLARYAEYLFRFLHVVKIEYLDDFQAYDLSQEINIPILASLDNWDLNSHIWKHLNWRRINNLEDGKALLCKVTHHDTSALPNDDINRELKFFPLFYKYFLIIGGGTQTYIIKQFGSTL